MERGKVKLIYVVGNFHEKDVFDEPFVMKIEFGFRDDEKTPYIINVRTSFKDGSEYHRSLTTKKECLEAYIKFATKFDEQQIIPPNTKKGGG